MTPTDVKIIRYTEGEFLIDIIDKGEAYEAWLSMDIYGASEYMFGVPKTSPFDGSEMTQDAFVRMVKDNLVHYVNGFKEMIKEKMV